MTETRLLKSPGTAASASRRSAWGRGDPRLWLLACCLLLALLPFATAPGDIIADTKFELAVNPAAFLGGALTLWNPQQFGVLLNQAVGYLFPMGPFFELLRLLGIAGWIAQRLWLSALLIAAFGGTVRLASRMGIGTPATRLAAGLAYALSPVALSTLGQTSGEFLPMALLPWIIIPLTDSALWVPGGGPGRRGPAGRARAVARSAVAVALCSGMNAASTIAVLVPVLIYILTRPGARTRVRLLAWWLPAVALVTSAWSVPLVLLSKYGVSIVPFTESAQVTSSTTSLLNILRGTGNWIGYQATNGQPDRPLAFLLATAVLPAVLAGLLAALGLAGIVRRGLPERRFLLWSVLGGVVIISLGYVSGLGNPLEGSLIALINGPGAPFRNLWKFDPMIRLPLALGLAHLLAAPRELAAARITRVRAAVAGLAAVALGSLAVLAVSPGLASPGSFAQVPPYWVSAADWLTAHAGSQAVLAEPGAAFGEYTWGSPMDDVLQALTNVDWAGRNLETVGSVGNERLLDAIDQRFAAGDGSAGLTTVLARMGVKYVLVRNDLGSAALAGTQLARVHDAVAISPGLTLAAQFGPQVGGTSDNAASGFGSRSPAVQIYQVAGAQAAAVVQPAAGTLRVYGAPESMITLANEDLLGDRPVLLNDDGAGDPVAGSVVTDSLRRRTVNFGTLRTNYLPTLTAGQPADTFLSADDYLDPAWDKYEAVAQYTGIKNVTASSSAADITTFANQWATGMLPYAAFDQNADTLWESGAFNGPFGQWLQVLFGKDLRFGTAATIGVAFADDPAIGPPVTRVTVTTAAGKVTDPVRMTGEPQPLRVPPGPSGWLRITVTGLAAPPSYPLFGTQVGIASVTVPGVSAGRAIVAPSVAGGDPSAVVLAKAQPYQSSCLLTTATWVCSPELATVTEEQYGFDHAFSEAYPRQAVLRGSAILTDSSLAYKYALAGRDQPAVTASSAFTGDPQDQALSAFDGNRATAWVASPADPDPRLTINWGQPRTISGVTIERPAGASGLTQVLITGSGGQRRGALISANGAITFAPMKTSSLTIAFTTGQAPVQVSDVVIPGMPAISAPGGSFRLACGRGPRLSVDGKLVPTAVTGSYTDLLTGAALEFTGCQSVTLAAGAHQVTEPPADAFDVQDVVLSTAGAGRISADAGTDAGTGGAAATAADTPVAATVLSWASSSRTLRVAAATRSYLEVNENFNAGWQAVIAGRPLQPVRLDGWKQAWVLAAGTAGVVTLTYQPQSLYRVAVAGGLAALVLCIGVALSVPRRRARRAVPWSVAPLTPEPASGLMSGRPRWRDRSRWRRWPEVALLSIFVAVAGLLLGGYPGAILLPVVTGMFLIPVRGWRLRPAPWLIGALFGAALVAGAVGEHLVFAGHSGAFVSAATNAIPQVICLVVVGALAAALCQPVTGQRPPTGERPGTGQGPAMGEAE